MNSPYLPASAVESSAESCSDGKPSAPLKSTNTVGGFSCSARMMDTWIRSQSGETLPHSTACRGVALSMSLAEGSPAKTLAPLVVVPELTVSVPACGPKWPESFSKYDPASSTWKTAQCSLLGGLAEFSETWPQWGLMVSGECSVVPIPALRTLDGDYGLLPTPVTKGLDGGKSGRAAALRRGVLPSLTVCGNYNRKGASATSGDGLFTALGFTPPPSFLEWLMGFPIGWSGLEPLATVRFRLWLKQHGASSEGM